MIRELTSTKSTKARSQYGLLERRPPTYQNADSKAGNVQRKVSAQTNRSSCNKNVNFEGITTVSNQVTSQTLRFNAWL